jgi:hypothetical protein
MRLTTREHLAGAFVRPQVDIALAIAQVGVGDALPLVAEAAAGPDLGEQDPVLHFHGELTGAGLHDLAARADPVAEVELLDSVVLVRPRPTEEQLDRGGRVDECGERELARRAVQHHATGDGHDHPGFLARADRGELLL